MNGEVKWYSGDKGFGFIVGEDGRDYFFHRSEVRGERREHVEHGTKVEFVPNDGPRGPKATGVRSLA